MGVSETRKGGGQRREVEELEVAKKASSTTRSARAVRTAVRETQERGKPLWGDARGDEIPKKRPNMGNAG